MLPQKLTWDLAQTQWAQQIDPVLSNPLVNGQLLTDITLNTGSNTISHKLGRKPQGWFIVSPDAAGSVYQDTTTPQVQPTLLLTLTSTADINCSIWIF